MGNKPYKTPCPKDNNANFMGIPYMNTAIKIAIKAAYKLALCPFIFFTAKAQKMVPMGTRAINKDQTILSNGSTTWFQFMGQNLRLWIIFPSFTFLEPH
jgi:hypothetical protein